MSHHHLSALGLHLGLVAPIVGHRHLRVHGFDSSREQKKMGWLLREESTAGRLEDSRFLLVLSGSCEKIVCTRGFGI